MTPSFVMIDDFVADPHELRRQALALGYDPALKDGNYPGLTSTCALPIPGLDDCVSRAIGAKVVPAPEKVVLSCRDGF